VSPTGLSPVVSGDCCATATDDKSVSEIVTEKKIDRIEILPSKSKDFTPSPPSSQRQRSPSRSDDSGIAAGAFGLGGQFGLGTPRNPILEGWEAGNRGQRHGYCISSTQAASGKPPGAPRPGAHTYPASVRRAAPKDQSK